MGRKRNLNSTLTRRETLKYGLYGGLAAGLAPSLWLSGCGRRTRRKGPNIIFILIDALRADRMGLYGYHRDTTPTIGAIGSEGVVFERVIAQSPWTQPSMASLFCSRYPSVHKVLSLNLAQAMQRGRAKKMSVFGESFTTLAEVLRDNGYETAGFIANFLMSGYYGFGQGFARYIDMPYRKQRRGVVAGGVLNRESLAWLRNRDSDKPFFLYMHYMDVHGSYYARAAFHEPLFDQVEKMPNKRKLSGSEKKALDYLAHMRALPIVRKYKELSDYLEFWSAFYDAGVREMDQLIADLIAGLKEMGLWDDSYVIITADHGEELQEHGYWSHGSTVYHTELHVPLILRWPSVLPAGKRIKDTIRLIDLMPTLLDQLHLPVVSGMQGRSFKDVIAEHPPARVVPAFSEAVKKPPQRKSLSLGDWKMIVVADQKTPELYNISEDPLEQDNLYAQHPSRLWELSQLLGEQITLNRKLASQVKPQERPVTPEDYEHLKSLGYVR